MKKITNKQLENLKGLIVKDLVQALEKSRVTCPKTMSGKHSWFTNNWQRKLCLACGMYKGF